MTSEDIKQLEEELRKRGIQIQVGGCGCCGSPWIKVAIDGVVILDDSEVDIDMFKENGCGSNVVEP